MAQALAMCKHSRNPDGVKRRMISMCCDMCEHSRNPDGVKRDTSFTTTK